MFMAEEVNTHSLFEEAAKRYVAAKIRDYFGLSFFEYLELPKDRIELLHQVAMDENRRKNNDADSALTDLESKMRGL